MKRAYSVEAIWDPEASTWVSESDIPGLVIEAATLTEFEDLVRAFVPQMLAENTDEDEARVTFTARRVLDLAAA